MKNVICCFGLILLISCSTDSNETTPPPITQYTLTTQVDPTIGGTVSPSSGTYADGTSVSLTATANTDYAFKEWTGGATGATSPVSVIMNANKSITAVFELIDTDGDTVTDSMDLCPDTPNGEAVDSDGCSFDQNHTYVPDDNFEQHLIYLNYDDVLDDYVLTSNINTITELYVDNGFILELTGIEDFIALEVLLCYSNQLTNLDVSNNTALTELSCSNNQLTSLDVSNNTALTKLNCASNQLTNIDVSNNIALTELNCGNNQLTNLDVNNNTALETLEAYDNQLTSLGVSNNTALELLFAWQRSVPIVVK